MIYFDDPIYSFAVGPEGADHLLPMGLSKSVRLTVISKKSSKRYAK